MSTDRLKREVWSVEETTLFPLGRRRVSARDSRFIQFHQG